MFHSIIIIIMFLHKFTCFIDILKAYKTQNTFGICSLTYDIAERISQLQL